jgi:nitroimidazol reductase NimA-like FMN-containing flavoprotein (pyridoxamine 5'-phosphate oxidase superfamily)
MSSQSTVRIVKAPAGGRSMTRNEVEELLSRSKLILRLATVNQDGDPEIQPVWYHYANDRLYVMTGHNSRKIRNIRHRKVVYFSVDTEISPYKGVKGKAVATILADNKKAVEIAEEMGARYLGSAKNPMAKRFTEAVRTGKDIVIEIVPEYFSVWDYGKAPSGGGE